MIKSVFIYLVSCLICYSLKAETIHIFHDWQVIQARDVCSMQSPSLEAGRGIIVGGVYPEVKSSMVFSISLTPFPKTSSVVQVLSKNQIVGFVLKAHDSRLWPENEAEDHTMVDAMKKGSKLKVRALQQDPVSFSLKGFTKALAFFSKTCGKN
jgi:hypothetical protein